VGLEAAMSVLQGLRVVEASSMVLVPSAGAILADFGADVIKVEPPEGDLSRHVHELPALLESEIPYFFVMDNRSKRGIVLDLKDPDGVAVLHRLVARADVFLTNYRPTALARLRLRWEDLAPLNPRLVYASASGFGEAGPEAGKPAYDTVVYWSRSGLESHVLTPDGRLGPIPAGSGDHPSALALFGAVMLALYARERSGRGMKVSTSLLANGAWTNATTLQALFCDATFHPKWTRDTARSFGAVYYQTRDGRLLKLSLVNPVKLWPRFCRAVGRPGLVDDPRFATPAARRQHAQELIGLLDGIFAEADAADWKARLEANDLPFAILPTYPEIAQDPQMAANGMFPELHHPRYGPLKTVDSPITVAGEKKVPPQAAPELGQHTTEILGELGYSPREIESFLARGIAAAGHVD
jgi:crotonobetainyl-CoA:carnitine CoA-transferase CaiB-like acyl-CoA transferase